MASTLSLFPSYHWAETSAQDIAIVWQKDTDDFPFLSSQISWAEFQMLLGQAIQQFQQKGICRGDLVAYCGSHRLCGVISYCAILAMGAKILMLNPAQTEVQRQTILQDNGVDYLISDQDFANFSAKITACYPFPMLNFEQAATLTLTSGSTGKPKAVVHAISAHLANAEGVCELMEFEKSHSWLLTLPLFHVSGQGIIWRWLLKGATLYIDENKATFFDTLRQVTHSSLVPTQLQRYLNGLNAPVSQCCLLGGTAIPSELIKNAQQYGITTFSGYGMTEMASTICATKNALDSAGVPLKHRDIKLDKGEIWVRGKPLALGYWQKNGSIQPLVNQEGWFQTKDRGEWNHHKQLIIKGRLDNMFISGGENIQPEEIERVIFQSNLVEQVFILPRADAEFGQRPVAIVQFRTANFTENLNCLKNWLSDKLEKFKQPIDYFPLDVEKYQKQGTIKISRSQLQQDLNNVTKVVYA